jgi:hypothetical protein
MNTRIPSRLTSLSRRALRGHDVNVGFYKNKATNNMANYKSKTTIGGRRREAKKLRGGAIGQTAINANRAVKKAAFFVVAPIFPFNRVSAAV